MRNISERLAQLVTKWAGTTAATVLAFAAVIGWTLGGFFVGFTDSYQMYINTSTTIITFLMVFLLQRASNKENLALHLKVNELLASHEQASNKMIGIERLSEREVRELWCRFMELAERAGGRGSHSIEEIPPSPGDTMKWMDK